MFAYVGLPHNLKDLKVLLYDTMPTAHTRAAAIKAEALQGCLAHKKTPTPLGPP